MADAFDPALVFIYGWELDAFAFAPGDVVVRITGEYACLKPGLDLAAYLPFGAAIEFCRRHETRPGRPPFRQRWCGVVNQGDYLVGAAEPCVVGPFGECHPVGAAAPPAPCALEARGRCRIPLRPDAPLYAQTDAPSIVLRYRWENPSWRRR